MPMQRRPARAFIAAIGVWVLLTTVAAGGPGDSPADYDCGTLTLYVLLRLEGGSPTLSDVERNLPPPRGSGYTMLELRDAASACGLRLKGVRLDNKASAFDRPMLIFVERGPHGHFLVARPVGHTDTLVQIIDPGSPPDVIDRNSWLNSEEWTGLALIPSRPNWPIRIAALVTVIVGLALVLGGVLQCIRCRSRRSAKVMT